MGNGDIVTLGFSLFWLILASVSELWPLRLLKGFAHIVFGSGAGVLG